MIFIIFVLYLLIRFYPYLFSPVPLGYDPGLYLYLWKSDFSLDWLRSIYPPVIYYLGKFLSFFVDPELLIIPLSFVVAIILFVSVYLYTQNKWTLFLLATSAIQYRLWWWYYLKNILAASFIFLYLYFDQKKSQFKYLVPIIMPLLHQPTSIIFFLILLFKKNYLSILFFIISFGLYYLPNYQTTIEPYFFSSISTFGVETGTFYSLSESLVLMLPYLPFVVVGLFLNIKNKKFTVIEYALFVSSVFPVFGLFLSRRFIPFVDLFAIIIAGQFISQHLDSRLKYFLVIFYSLIIFSFIHQNSSALINQDEYQEIKLIQDTPSNSYVLVTDNEYTPWIYGYSNRNPIAPGFGENDIYWSDSEWQEFWLSADPQREQELLKKLPQPLFVWKGDKTFPPINTNFTGECWQKYSWHLFKFVCH